MTDVKIVPIFNQAAPGIWDSFVDIEIATMRTNYNYILDAEDRASKMRMNIRHWCRGTHFAFGAYHDNQMIGFIQGDVHGRTATIQSLNVLYEYQGMHTGRRLLWGAERALSVFCTSVELVALTKAEPFYRRHGYHTKYGTNRYQKTDLPAPRCECLPIFRCNTALVRRLQALCPEFNADIVNRQHQPLFAYYDIDGGIIGYATRDHIFTNTTPEKKNMVTSILQKKLEHVR